VSKADGEVQTEIDLSGMSDLQNIPSTRTISFRLYAWGAITAVGTFDIGRYDTGFTTNSLAVDGIVSALPAPPSNDNMASAIEIQLKTVCTSPEYSTASSTTQKNEPVLKCRETNYKNQK